MNAEPDQPKIPNTQTETSRSSGDGRFPPTGCCQEIARGGESSASFAHLTLTVFALHC